MKESPTSYEFKDLEEPEFDSQVDETQEFDNRMI
jgi:hypothetical protein